MVAAVIRKRVRFKLPIAISSLVCGTIVETIGYATRIVHNNTGKLMPHCIQAASSFLVQLSLLHRSIWSLLEYFIPIHAGKTQSFPWIGGRAFVLSDIVTFVVQVGGSKTMVLLICYHCICCPDKDALQAD
jgi:hypothetical protein